MEVASKTAVTTTLSASSAGLVVVIIHTILGNPADVSPVLNGNSCFEFLNITLVTYTTSVLLGLFGGPESSSVTYLWQQMCYWLLAVVDVCYSLLLLCLS